jgi:hypothetical protein
MDSSIRTTADDSHLRILSVCFYIIGAMSALGGCILASFALLGVAIMTGVIQGMPQELAIFLGLILVVIESILALFVWTMSFFEILTGRSLATHSRYRLCFVIACIELLNIPFGTILAVFTIIVLQRPSVYALFEGDRDRRLQALEEFDDDAPLKPPKGTGDNTIREGLPM